jgi:UDP-glucose 4-epimerase
MFPRIGRVYVSTRARADLGWTPAYDFRHVLDRLKAGEDPRSPLARAIGAKGYHDEPTGVYTS